MSDIAKAGLGTVVDLADHTTKAVSVAVQETVNAGVATQESIVTVEGKTLNAAMEEAESLRQQYIDSIRKIFNAVGEIV